MGLEGVARAYRGLQGVPKELQGVTRGECGLQAVRWSFKG